jgi:hypothetical protein
MSQPVLAQVLVLAAEEPERENALSSDFLRAKQERIKFSAKPI